MKKTVFFHIFIPLLLGTGLYLLLCPEAFVSRGVYALLGLKPSGAIAWDGAVLRLIRNHLADMLWAWALACSAALVLGRGKSLWAAGAAIGTGIAVELAQRALGTGTFDWLDILLEALAAIAAGLWIAHAEGRRPE